MPVQVSPYVTTPVVPFVTLQTLSLPVTGPAGTVPVSLGVGNTTSFQTLSGAALAAAVILAPDSATRNTITPGADTYAGLIFQEHSSGQSQDMIQIVTSNGGNHYDLVARQGADSYFKVGNPHNDVVLLIRTSGIADQTLGVCQGFEGGVSDLFQWKTIDPTNTFIPDRLAVNASANLVWSKADTANTLVSTGSIVSAFLSNVAGSTKGRMILNAIDSNGAREILRGDADGANPRIGFLGANAVVQQSTASAAGIAAIRTDTLANAVTDIRVILTALRTWAVTNGLTANTA